MKSAFRLDLLSFIGIPVQAQEQRLTNVPASGKLVHEKKTRRVGIDSKNSSSLCMLELKWPL